MVPNPITCVICAIKNVVFDIFYNITSQLLKFALVLCIAFGLARAIFIFWEIYIPIAEFSRTSGKKNKRSFMLSSDESGSDSAKGMDKYPYIVEIPSTISADSTAMVRERGSSKGKKNGKDVCLCTPRTSSAAEKPSPNADPASDDRIEDEVELREQNILDATSSIKSNTMEGVSAAQRSVEQSGSKIQDDPRGSVKKIVSSVQPSGTSLKSKTSSAQETPSRRGSLQARKSASKSSVRSNTSDRRSESQLRSSSRGSARGSNQDRRGSSQRNSQQLTRKNSQ